MQDMHSFDLFEQYHKNTLPEQARKDLEARLATDEAFAQDWAAYLLMAEAFEEKSANARIEADALREQLRQEGFFEETHKQVEAELTAEKVAAPAQMTARKGGRWRQWAVAAGLAALIAAMWLLNKQPPAPGIVAHNKGIQNPENTAQVPQNGSNDGDSTEKPDKKIYASAIKIGQYRSGASRSGLAAQTPATANMPSFAGFCTTLGNKTYFICAARAVSAAAKMPGAVLTHNAKGQTLTLTLVGKDDFFDVAVLSVQEADLAETFPIRDRDDPLGGKTALLKIEGKTPQTIKGVIKDRENGCLLFKADAHLQESAYGPVFDENGSVIGLETHFAAAAFPGFEPDPKHRMALAGDLLNEVVGNILANKERAYIGIAFSETDKPNHVSIADIIPGSPASPYEDELLGDKVESINQKPVSGLNDVLDIMATVKPNQSVHIRHRDSSGASVVVLIAPKMDKTALAKVGTAIFRQPELRNAFVYLNETVPSVEYIGARFAKGIYAISACCPSNEACLENVFAQEDMGEHLRRMAFVGHGRLLTYNQNNERSTFDISFKNRMLWH